MIDLNERVERGKKRYGAQTVAYKGYLITKGNGETWYISKEGFHIGSGNTLEACKKQVDQLVD